MIVWFIFEFRSYFHFKESYEKSFGIVFSIFFLIIAFYPVLFNNSLNTWSLYTSIFLFLLSFIYPKIFKFPNYIWLKIGFLLGLIVSPVIMFLIFIVAFVPIGFFFKILRKDLLNQKINDNNLKTYWKNRTHKMESLKKQF